jgi:hypothetical protein
MQVMRLDVHFGSGDVLVKGRQLQAPQVSEKVRQSASVVQLVDVPGSDLACDAAGAGPTGGAMDAEGSADGAATTAGDALGAGEGSCSPRLQATPRAAKSRIADAVTGRRARTIS